MGVACWALWAVVGDVSEAWVDSSSASGRPPHDTYDLIRLKQSVVPIIAIPLTLALVHYHPEPVDDCPCFEDAIAILSVLLGSYLGHWRSTTPQSKLLPAPDLLRYDDSVGATMAVVRVVVGKHRPAFLPLRAYIFLSGIGIVFAWRLFAKATLLAVLPSIFRAASRGFDVELPTRKHYTAATYIHLFRIQVTLS